MNRPLALWCFKLLESTKTVIFSRWLIPLTVRTGNHLNGYYDHETGNACSRLHRYFEGLVFSVGCVHFFQYVPLQVYNGGISR